MILFRTPGTLAAEALTTFGLTSKDESQIGRFGTGLKYATAIVLREEGEITIRTCDSEHKLGIEAGIFRGKPVAYATLDGARLPFTTELGRDWKPWMAFREFYANTLDEGGTFERINTPPAPTPGHTDIIIDCLALDAVLDNFEEHFIDPDETPLVKTSEIEIYRGESRQIFYQGFAVMELQLPACYRYNILRPIELTEDRTANGTWQCFSRIENALAELDNEEILTNALRADAPFESGLDFPTYRECSAAFLGVVDKLGGDASAPAELAAAHTRHRQAKNSGSILESEENSSGAIINAVAHLRLLGAPLEGWRFAFAPIPSGAPTEVDSYRKLILVNASFRGDEEATAKLLITAFCAEHEKWVVDRIIRLAQDLYKKLETPNA